MLIVLSPQSVFIARSFIGFAQRFIFDKLFSTGKQVLNEDVMVLINLSVAVFGY